MSSGQCSYIICMYDNTEGKFVIKWHTHENEVTVYCTQENMIEETKWQHMFTFFYSFLIWDLFKLNNISR